MQSYVNQFKNFLILERSLSSNSVEAYVRDVQRFYEYLELIEWKGGAKAVTDVEIGGFLKYLTDLGMSAYTQSRMLSGTKAYFRFLLGENILETDPTELIDSPKLPRKLPDVLSYTEIVRMMESIDHSTAEGTRNRAILEVLYSCGLRVSELINLKWSNCYFNEGYIKVVGKGNKIRLVPIGRDAIKYTRIYMTTYRKKMFIDKGCEDLVFLNRRGGGLTRVMIFLIIKNIAKECLIEKNVSPHTFRHSFATHLIEGGASLRAVQEMLGHESITTTEIYTHLDRDYLRQVITEFHPRA